ncbi:hypothetical protein SNK05_013580 [Fusarium graminearum]
MSQASFSCDKYRIRPATYSDVPAVTRLYASSFGNEPLIDFFFPSRKQNQNPSIHGLTAEIYTVTGHWAIRLKWLLTRTIAQLVSPGGSDQRCRTLFSKNNYTLVLDMPMC